MKFNEEAYNRYPCTVKGTKGMIDAGKRKHFIEGAKFVADGFDDWIYDMLNSGHIECSNIQKLIKNYHKNFCE